MTGSISILTSRRVNFNKCKYWKQIPNVDLDIYAVNNACDGFFYAKRENSQSDEKNALNGNFLVNKSSVMISTSDKINLDAGDLVYFNGEYWYVQSLQKQDIHKTEQYMKRQYYKTYIQLRK